MQTFTFTCSTQENSEGEETELVVVETKEEQLTEVLAAFDRFLRGAGFYFPGSVTIGDDTDQSTKPDVG